ncbi:hypothetical protein WKY82_12805 [Gordonia malaquae]|uniref:hypothetical protein n=1 Tax=Gordonia malaquae TaxID=410332 RepID=UPI0030C78F38
MYAPTGVPAPSPGDAPEFPLSHFLGNRRPSRATLVRAIQRGDLTAVFEGKGYLVTEEAYAQWRTARRRPAAVGGAQG